MGRYMSRCQMCDRNRRDPLAGPSDPPPNLATYSTIMREAISRVTERVLGIHCRAKIPNLLVPFSS